MGPFDILFAQKEDVSRIFEVSRAHLDTDKPEIGFLGSDYPKEVYDLFYKYSQHALDPDNTGPKTVMLKAVDRSTGELEGFLVGYNSAFAYAALKQPDEFKNIFSEYSTEARLIEKFGAEQGFFVIKQVGVGENAVGKGIGSQLYFTLFRLLSGETKANIVTGQNANRSKRNKDTFAYPAVMDVFAAISRHPENLRSARFHRSFGFLPVLSYGKLATTDVSEKETEVVHTTVQGALQAKKSTFAPSEHRDQVLMSELQSARDLYMHEDNLNWTKLSFLTQYTGVLLAAQFILPTIRISALGDMEMWFKFGCNVAISLLAIYLMGSFTNKIRSGLAFMASHKRAVTLTESKLHLLSAACYPTVSWAPRQSRTVILIDFAKIVFSVVIAISFCFNALVIFSGS